MLSVGRHVEEALTRRGLQQEGEIDNRNDKGKTKENTLVKQVLSVTQRKGRLRTDTVRKYWRFFTGVISNFLSPWYVDRQDDLSRGKFCLMAWWCDVEQFKATYPVKYGRSIGRSKAEVNYHRMFPLYWGSGRAPI